MAIIGFTQESAFSTKYIEIDTDEVVSVKLGVSFLGNYKLHLGLKNGNTIKVSTSYYEDVQNLISLIRKGKEESR